MTAEGRCALLKHGHCAGEEAVPHKAAAEAEGESAAAVAGAAPGGGRAQGPQLRGRQGAWWRGLLPAGTAAQTLVRFQA